MKSIATQRANSWEEASRVLPDFVGASDIAEFFGVTSQTVLNWHRKRHLEADTPPSDKRRIYRYPRQRVIDFAKANNLEINLPCPAEATA